MMRTVPHDHLRGQDVEVRDVLEELDDLTAHGKLIVAVVAAPLDITEAGWKARVQQFRCVMACRVF